MLDNLVQQPKLADRIETKARQLQRNGLFQLFQADKSRFERFKFDLDALTIDLSKHFIDTESVNLLTDFAKQKQLEKKIKSLFTGELVNQSEQRAALHIALRDVTHVYPYEVAIHQQVQGELQQMREFSQAFDQGKITGYDDQSIENIIHIGIGGSELGPKLLYEVIKTENHRTKVHFVSGVDEDALQSLLKRINPATTLCCIASKSFTTEETLLNAVVIKDWLQQNAGDLNWQSQLVGISANPAAMTEFGIAENRQFFIWDWVGGRYSIWSAISLSVVLACGYQQFYEFLQGAALVDKHFYTTTMEKNLPVLLAFLNYNYTQFFHAQTQMLAVYHEKLKYLPGYLQQLFMESLGKQVDMQGKRLQKPTGQIVWGGLGCNGQHAYYQMLHQGQHFIPVDFFVMAADSVANSAHEQHNFTNALAQARALMLGKSAEDNTKYYPGNQPSTTILFAKLDAKTLGLLIALYEHIIYVQSVFLNINPFDQFGVELGKNISATIKQALLSGNYDELDQSTAGLIQGVNSP
ncbi:MAG: glucose-6-phosphate isomerase [Pseudomonadota bacterium]